MISAFIQYPDIAGRRQDCKFSYRDNCLVVNYGLCQALNTILVRELEIMAGFVGKRNRLSEKDQGSKKPTCELFIPD